MKFEKQFPSWEGKSIMECVDGKEYDLLSKKWIQEHCLDKQKVKESIEKFDFTGYRGNYEGIKRNLKKELGLE